MTISKKDIDVKIKKHNKIVEGKQGTLGNKDRHIQDLSRTKTYTKNSNVRIICPKTGVVLKEITPQDKGFFKDNSFNTGYSKNNLISYKDHEYSDNVNDEFEIKEAINRIKDND